MVAARTHVKTKITDQDGVTSALNLDVDLDIDLNFRY